MQVHTAFIDAVSREKESVFFSCQGLLTKNEIQKYSLEFPFVYLQDVLSHFLGVPRVVSPSWNVSLKYPLGLRYSGYHFLSFDPSFLLVRGERIFEFFSPVVKEGAQALSSLYLFVSDVQPWLGGFLGGWGVFSLLSAFSSRPRTAFKKCQFVAPSSSGWDSGDVLLCSACLFPSSPQTPWLWVKDVQETFSKETFFSSFPQSWELKSFSLPVLDSFSPLGIFL